MEKLIETLQTNLGEALPGVFGALVLFVIGWIVAKVIKAVIQKALSLAKLNENINKGKADSTMNLEGGIAGGVYYFIMAIVLLAVFNQLGLTIVADPIQKLVSKVLEFIPNLISGAVLILVAGLIGTVVKQVTTTALAASGIDKAVKTSKSPISQTLGQVAFSLIILLFLPAILGVFALEGLMQPAQSMIDDILGMLPNILAAGMIIGIGWFIAKILSEIVSNLLEASGANNFATKIGLAEDFKISGALGKLVFVLVFVPTLISGLDALAIEAIAKPATEMLNVFMGAIPNVLTALIILLVSYVIGKPVSNGITKYTSALGIDEFPKAIGIKNSGKSGKLSSFLGKGVFFFIMLFATVEASNLLGFGQISEIIAILIQFGGQILLGSVIIAAGLWIANMVSDAMTNASNQPNAAATIVHVVILGLVIAMGLRSMGIANDIVNMAFGLSLGATAIAFAVSFGLGGREAAGKHLDYVLSGLRNNDHKGNVSKRDLPV